MMKCSILRQSAILIIATAKAIGGQICDKGSWGTPNFDDCQSLLDQFANGQDHSARIFDEEQLSLGQNGAWTGLWHWVGAEEIARAVQIPRVYSRRKYHAILPILSGLMRIETR